MAPRFMGYLAKKTAKNPEWLQAFGVEEIGSICDCFSKEAPKDYGLSGWNWNASGCYGTEEAARQTVPTAETADYTLFAYRIHPLIFDENGARDFRVEDHCPDLPEEELPDGYRQIGYDVAEGCAQENCFSAGCSPLSCNSAADSFTVNRWCLLETPEVARQAAEVFGTGKIPVEPPPYFIFEVWMKDPAESGKK